jgi:hypothetical protein
MCIKASAQIYIFFTMITTNRNKNQYLGAGTCTQIIDTPKIARKLCSASVDSFSERKYLSAQKRGAF